MFASRNGSRALERAADTRKHEIVELLLKRWGVNSLNEAMKTASRYGDLEAVKRLRGEGADNLNEAITFGRSSVHKTIVFEH